MRYTLLLLLLLPITLMAQTSPPAIHSPAFSDYYQDSTNRPVVTGRILNLPDSVDRKKMIGYSPVSILSDLQQEIKVDVAPDGTFSLRFFETYPAQEIWLWMNGGNDGLYYGTLLVREGLHLELDYTKLIEQGGVEWDGGPGVAFSGPDAELTRARNALTTKQMTKGYNSMYIPIMMDRKANAATKYARMDSVYQESSAYTREVLKDYSSETVDFLLNEGRSEYLGTVNVVYWNEDAPAGFEEAYLKHAPRVMSNGTSDYYRYFASRINAAAHRAAGSPADSVLTNKEKVEKQLAVLNTELAKLDPARADLVYLYQSAKDPVMDLFRLENALENVSSPWVQNLLQKRYEKVMEETKLLEATLRQIVPLTEPADLGEAVGNLPFGADLYAVGDDLSGEELLAKLRGAFAGKALYLDFWAVWCQPCLGEMPHSARVHEDAEGLPLDFVYLCTDSGGDQAQWKNLIAKHEVPGTHLFVPNKAHSELMELFSGRGYPTYVLLKEDGTPVLDVKRPSGLNRKELQKLLGR